ncbi:hypothetical protein [Pontibacter actiniarum]|uniref:Lipocalin-like domain-containing protein n=1 Tax=Pontibacter actiniarum TaxID=323450 RepID=A0A1X9YNP1_9BACT|nr:hypothetical protein [Pontibacter actiniarum]ARS34441.1 hypothetical protein CA264_02725 [Pontibacter actiniarum]
MKTTITSLFSLLFASAFLVGCEDCGSATITEPTVADTEWLVYSSGDTAVFKDENADTVWYVRTGIYAQSTPGDGYNVSDECIEKLNTQIANIMEDTREAADQRQPYLGTLILSKPDSLLVRIGVGTQATWSIDTAAATQEKEVNGKTYTGVYVLEGEGTKDTDVKNVYFNKSDGFLYVEFNNGRKLELIEVR